MSKETLVVFHRCGGKSLGYPPNTLLTAQWALEYVAKAIEYDIVYCKDPDASRVVVIEPKLLKQAGLDINDLAWSDVSTIEAGNERVGHVVPGTLEEMIVAINTTTVTHQIHLKGNHPKTTETVVQKMQGINSCVLTTFDIEVIKKIKVIDPKMRVGWIVKPKQEKGSEGSEDLTALVAASGRTLPPYSGEELGEIIQEAKDASVDVVILCGPRIQNKNTVMQVQNAGYEVGAWGVGTNLDLAKRLIDYKINRFTLDNPEQLSEK